MFVKYFSKIKACSKRNACEQAFTVNNYLIGISVRLVEQHILNLHQPCAA